MRVALPVWRERISPVFDVAGRLLVVDFEQGAERHRSAICLEDDEPASRARKLAELGIEVLICGGISRPLEALVSGRGIRVLARRCGGVEEVLEAFRSGRLAGPSFAMPGCWRHRRGACRGPGRSRNRWQAPKEVG